MIGNAKDKSNIIFFDGVCNLCNFWVKYVVRNDPHGVFYFSSLQSEFATNFLTQNDINSDFETIILFTEGRFLKESDAVVSILFKIGRFKIPFNILEFCLNLEIIFTGLFREIDIDFLKERIMRSRSKSK